MLPRWHFFFGLLLTIGLYAYNPDISILHLSLIFLASWLIDIDHYCCAVHRTGSWRLRDAYSYHDTLGKQIARNHQKGIRKKYDFHLFHTLEFHALIALISIWWTPAFYIFIGMAFHSLLDLFTLINKDAVYLREYFFFTWLWKRMN